MYLLKFKHEVFTYFQIFLALVERQSGDRLIILRIDRDGEFLSREFNTLCAQMGIKHVLPIPYTPQQNEVAERKK